MLTLHCKIPSCVNFFLVQREPANNDFHLLSRQRSSKQLTIYPNGGLMLSVIDMHMRLIFLYSLAHFPE